MEIKTFLPSDLLGPLNEVEAKNAPKVLYVAGDDQLLRSGRKVSMVGSGAASPNGLKRAEFLASELSKHDIIVVTA